MTRRNLNWVLVTLASLALSACESTPKVIESESAENSSAVFNDASTPQVTAMEDHKVVAKEALNTTRYTYLNVTEGENTFWIAVPRQEVEIGSTYYFKGGLLKKDFFSQEYNRVFETLYLVSNISKQPAGSGGSTASDVFSGDRSANAKPEKIEPIKGAIKISELLANPAKYEGKRIIVTGKCTKLNANIMNRNWIHIQDGSADKSDLTVTTTEMIQPGAVVSFEGIIVLNKDFGAGYKYDVLMEEAVVKK